ncbi:MAG TPA: hypothetical protein VN634_14110 [Candidatus Limnocylindrales bacterium]|jgi:hypothetical protein|nr:hypothetical protein [Candidatus Limnocylindrales bacterium]
MMLPASSSGGLDDRCAPTLEERFEQQVERDRALLRIFNLGTLAWSLLTVVTLMTLVIPMRRTSPWLILMSAYAIATRLGVLLARSALSVPEFVARLDDEDESVRSAARTVFDRHRAQITRSLSVNRPGASRSSAGLSYEDAADAGRRRDIGTRRRWGMICLALWCVVTMIVVVILVSTGAGPTG